MRDERLPPHNVEAEQALLGALLIDNRSRDACGDLVGQDFYEPAHGRIWDAAVELIERGAVANPVTLRNRFAGDEALKDVGGAAYLARLAGAAVSLYQVGHYADAIRETAKRRAILAAAQNLMDAAWNEGPEADPADVVSERGLQELTDVQSRGDARARLTTMRSAIGAAFREAEAARKREREAAVSTGLASLDRMMRGFMRRRFYVIAGRPSMGKSGLTLAMARAAAAQGQPVLLFSHEMPPEELGARALAEDSWRGVGQSLAYSEIERGAYTVYDADALARIAAATPDVPLLIDGRQGLNVAQIRQQCRMVQRQLAASQLKLGLVIVDTINKVRDSGRWRDNNVKARGEISNDLATLAENLNVAVVAVSQLNRDVERRTDKRPQMSDLRESGEIEQDAHVVLLLYREAYYVEREQPADAAAAADRDARLAQVRNRLEIIVGKNRQGPTGTASIMCDIAANVFRDFAEQRQADLLAPDAPI